MRGRELNKLLEKKWRRQRSAIKTNFCFLYICFLLLLPTHLIYTLPNNVINSQQNMSSSTCPNERMLNSIPRNIGNITGTSVTSSHPFQPFLQVSLDAHLDVSLSARKNGLCFNFVSSNFSALAFSSTTIINHSLSTGIVACIHTFGLCSSEFP